MGPILFKIGPVTIYSYGFMLALAFLATTTLAMRHAAKEGIASEKILDLMLVILITGIIGSRIFYVALNWRDFLEEPLSIFLLNRGGLAVYGGFAIAIPSGIYFIRKNGLALFKTLDLMSLYIVLGQAIGRIGCFFNGCCYGKETTSFIAMYFPAIASRAHPTQLYSSFALVVIFVVLRRNYNRTYRFEGEIFFSYLIFYSVMRFFMEMLRGDSPSFILNYTLFQCISVVLFIASLFFYAQRRRRWKSTLSQ